MRNNKKAAPHKPIMILALLDLVGLGIITENKVVIDKSLKNAFIECWSKYIENTSHARIEYPLFHLQTSEFWKFIPKPGFEAVLK